MTATEEEQALNAQLSRASARLEDLVRDLHGIEHELDDLSSERQKHQLLEQISVGLEELDALGGSALFWGEQARAGQTHAHVLAARGRADAFEKHLSEIDDRRDVVLEEIESLQQDTEVLEDALYETTQRAQRRKLEWVIERDVERFQVRESVMPWTRDGEDDRRFRKTLALALLLSLLFGMVFPLIDIPMPEGWAEVEVPERLTRLIRDLEPPPPPKPVLDETKPEVQKLAEESSPTKTTPKPPEAPKGILAFREKFSGLAESMPSARLGAQARIRKSGKAASGRPQRSLVTSQLPGSSGGIDIGSLSRDVGGGGEGIEGVEIARATSSIGTGAAVDRPLSDGPGPSRTDEEIQIVFDRHKAALYRVYNRELRRDPTLQGQIVLRIRIEPDGSVSLCDVQSTDMKAPNLSKQIVERVKQFDFGAKEGVSAITILYPIDFLPAA